MDQQKDRNESFSYRNSGVDIKCADRLIETVTPAMTRTFRPGWISMPRGFGALFEVPKGYRDPVLVSGTDGVGTKLKVVFELDRHETIGIDLVAMCVNDIIAHGAEPLFFLDYFATGELESDTAREVIEGIASGCEQAGCALVGGETAEMPGMYALGEYDLAGFAVGVVEKDRIINGDGVSPGDVIIGAASSGVHANGFSLIRNVIAQRKIPLSENIGGVSLGALLLTPTRIYARAVREILQQARVSAIAHITGGGMPGNVNRVLPDGTKGIIDGRSWRRSAIFDWLQATASIDSHEMLATFNCGIGMVFVAPSDEAATIVRILEREGIQSWQIGEVVASQGAGQLEIRGL